MLRINVSQIITRNIFLCVFLFFFCLSARSVCEECWALYLMAWKWGKKKSLTNTETMPTTTATESEVELGAATGAGSTMAHRGFTWTEPSKYRHKSHKTSEAKDKTGAFVVVVVVVWWLGMSVLNQKWSNWESVVFCIEQKLSGARQQDSGFRIKGMSSSVARTMLKTTWTFNACRIFMIMNFLIVPGLWPNALCSLGTGCVCVCECLYWLESWVSGLGCL